MSRDNPRSPAWAQYYNNHPDVVATWGESNGREPNCTCQPCDPDGTRHALDARKKIHAGTTTPEQPPPPQALTEDFFVLLSCGHWFNASLDARAMFLRLADHGWPPGCRLCLCAPSGNDNAVIVFMASRNAGRIWIEETP